MTSTVDLAAVWDLAPTAMLLVHVDDLTVVRANRAAEALGLPTRGPLAEGAEAQRLGGYLTLAAAGGGTVPGRLELPGDRPRSLRCRACRYPAEGARWVLLTVSAAPADQRFVQLNEELAETRRKLLERAQRQQQERRLLEAQKLESLGVLAGGIAHDFNNLLVAVVGNIGLARMEPGDTTFVSEVLEDAESAAHQAADLCRQLLAYSGRGRFVVEAVDLSAMVRDMAKLLGVGVGKSVRLQQRLQQGLPSVEADVIQLRQVVMNLITNASEAIGSEEGVVRLVTDVVHLDAATARSLQSGAELSEGTYVMVEVSDTGEGMDEATASRIFEPFFTTKFTGRGLGLAAVMGIVRAHGGALRVYSEPGQGTTVRVWLPAIVSTDGGPSGASRPTPGRAAGAVLVIDDEPRVRTMAERVLGRAGFQVFVAENGEEGLTCFERHAHAIRCVLLDLTMPGLSGEEVFQRLRRQDANVRIVMSSGFTEQEVSSRLSGKRVDAFLPKPWTPQQLLDAVCVDDG